MRTETDTNGKLYYLTTSKIVEGQKNSSYFSRKYKGLHNGIFLFQPIGFRLNNVQCLYSFSDIERCYYSGVPLFELSDYLVQVVSHDEQKHYQEILKIAFFLAKLDSEYDVIDDIVEKIYGELLDELELEFGEYNPYE